MSILDMDTEQKTCLADSIHKAVMRALWVDGGGMYPDHSLLESKTNQKIAVRIGIIIGEATDPLKTADIIVDMISGFLGGAQSPYIPTLQTAVEQGLREFSPVLATR